MGLILRSGRSPGGGRGNPFQYFCLENPMDRGAWRATAHGVIKELDTTEVTQHAHMGTNSVLSTKRIRYIHFNHEFPNTKTRTDADSVDICCCGHGRDPSALGLLNQVGCGCSTPKGQNRQI